MAGTRNPNLGSAEPQNASAFQQSDQGPYYLKFPRDEKWWTGLPPVPGKCPGVLPNGTMASLPIPNLQSCTRQDVLDYFNNTWTLTEVLFSGLTCEEAFRQPPYHGLRHPLIFYYVHPVVLYVNKLRLAELIPAAVDANFESLFETGVDEMSWDDMSKNAIDWPSIEQAHKYRGKVYETVRGVIMTDEGLSDGHAPITMDSPLWSLFMSFEHERIHLETSSVLIREAPASLVRKPDAWPDLHPSFNNEEQSSKPVSTRDYPDNQLISIPEHQVQIGKPTDFPSFGWDNEYGSRTVDVSKFQTSRCLISNSQFWDFVKDGGYLDQSLWSEIGWNWRTFRNVKWPTFWVPCGPAGSHEYKLRTIFEVIPMQWSWPVVVNYHEAKAYCRWLSKKEQRNHEYRLLSEAEHHALRMERGINDGACVLDEGFDLNLVYGSESPVDGGTAGGDEPRDLFGNVWQWCEDHFNPLPGFKVHKFYDDFSTPCFDGEHQIIMGGSFASTGDEASTWARFHFRPHFTQHAGFRIVWSGDGNDGHAERMNRGNERVNPYETNRMLSEYLLLHYGPADVQMPTSLGIDVTNFPNRCAQQLIDWCRQLKIPTGSALDIGCAVGGASFALASAFDKVDAVDLSRAFIETAQRIQSGELNTFNVLEEGNLQSELQFQIEPSVRKKVNFKRADACSLPSEFVDFDAVLLANVLCRLPSPMACLGRMAGMRGVVKNGGLLFITSPFTWMTDYTPEEVWLGGFKDNDGMEHWSKDGLIAALEPDFELLDCFDMPMAIREHRRKYQLIFPLATVWRRR